MATKITTSITIGGKRTELAPTVACDANGKANSIFCPLGPAPTMGWFCMLKRHLDELDVNAAHTITWTEISKADDVYTNGVLTTAYPAIERILNFVGMYIVKSERLLQGGVGDANALHLVTFSDARHIAASSSDTGTILANLRSYANNSDFLTGTTSYTDWETLVEALWDACGNLGTFPGLPTTITSYVDGAPNNHWLIGLNAYRALNAVLDQLDCALQHNPFSTNYGIVELGATQTLTSSTGNARLKWDGEPKTPVVSLAGNINIYHHKHYQSYGQENDTELANNWAYNGHTTVNTVATNISGATGLEPLWDDLPVLLDENNTVSNQAAITTRNTNRVHRYVTRWSVSNYHRIYTGLLSDFIPAGQVRAVVWRNYGDGEENVLGGTVTEYVCCANLITGCSNSGSNESSDWAWLDKQIGTPERQQYLSPDYGRGSYPNYPRLPNIVQVHQGGYSVGDTVTPDVETPDGIKMYSGRVKRWVANAMTTLDNCWILFVDEYDTKHGDIAAKEDGYYGPARLSGVSTISGILLPVYTIHKGGPGSNDIIVFQLTGTLALGGFTTASICYLNGVGEYVASAVITDQIVVTDFYRNPGEWQGVEGYIGVGKQRSNSTLTYDILWMERPALFSRSTLTANFVTPSSGVAVNAETSTYFQQGEKVPPGTAQVFDPVEFYPKAITGAKTLAVWNDIEQQREAVVSQQQGIYARALLSQTLLPGSIDPITITDFQITSFSPFNLTPSPLPTSCSNVFCLRGEISDQVQLLWDHVLTEWVIVSVKQEQRYIEFVTPTSGSGPYLKGDLGPDRFTGQTVTGDPATPDYSISRACIIEFVDYKLIGPSWVYVARANKSYSAYWAGQIGDVPLYRAAIGEQEWYGKYTSTIAKGSSASFTLWYNGAATTVTMVATCRFNAYTANKYAIIKCMEGELVANKVEC